MFDMRQFIKDRDEALTAFVMDDDLSKVLAYCIKYRVPISDKPNVLRASIYKAVQEVTSIPQEVKDIAAEKCRALGFSPYITERGRE